jgi:hypothetical protein
MDTVGHSIADIEATRSLYRQFTPHICDCAYCRNLRAKWRQWVTVETESLLASFGIDPEKPVEIIDFGKTENGRLYQVEWAFLIISKDNPPVQTAVSGPDNAEIMLSSGGIPAPCFDDTGRRWSLRIQRTNVPWVLPEPEPAQE